jgi:hypothetical protein
VSSDTTGTARQTPVELSVLVPARNAAATLAASPKHSSCATRPRRLRCVGRKSQRKVVEGEWRPDKVTARVRPSCLDGARCREGLRPRGALAAPKGGDPPAVALGVRYPGAARITRWTSLSCMRTLRPSWRSRTHPAARTSVSVTRSVATGRRPRSRHRTCASRSCAATAGASADLVSGCGGMPGGFGGIPGVGGSGLSHASCRTCGHAAHDPEHCDFPGCACPNVAASSRLIWWQLGGAITAGVVVGVLAHALVSWF